MGFWRDRFKSASQKQTDSMLQWAVLLIWNKLRQFLNDHFGKYQFGEFLGFERRDSEDKYYKLGFDDGVSKTEKKKNNQFFGFLGSCLVVCIVWMIVSKKPPLAPPNGNPGPPGTTHGNPGLPRDVGFGRPQARDMLALLQIVDNNGMHAAIDNLLRIGYLFSDFSDKDGFNLDLTFTERENASNLDGFEIDDSQLVQELGGGIAAVERQKALLQELMSNAKNMLRNTEMNIHSFMMRRPRFVRPNPGGASTATMPPQSPETTATPGSTGQPASTSIVPVSDFCGGLTKKPSPYLQQTVARFEKYLGECRQWIEESEQLLLLDSDRNSSHPGSSLLQSLPKVMSNIHDFFVYVAPKVESIHQYIESIRMANLADQHCRGDGNDPFLEADRRETAKLEAAAKRVHPTLHLPVNSQPFTRGTGLFGSSTTPATSTAPRMSSSGSGLFSTPSSSVSASSLFAIPSTSAPLSSLFGPSGACPQSTLFGTSSSSLFPASTPSFSNIASSFGSTSAFSTPFAAGAAAGSEASFGTVSKSIQAEDPDMSTLG